MEIVKASIKDLQAMNNLWNEVVNEEGFYKPFTYPEYQEKMLTNPEFSFDKVLLAKENDELIGFTIIVTRENNSNNGYITAMLVKKEYRHQKVATKLLKRAEELLKEMGKKKAIISNFLPSCYPWYIPNTDKHDHPCAPGIRINSNEYFFYLQSGYKTFNYCDAFHLALANYELSPKIKEILDNNKKDNITIEVYNEEKHYGMEEFYEKLNIYDFEKPIRDNLSLEKPYPFLVISENGKIKGWTGAMWNEESGRGHFDGIAILEEIRGRGLGKALFSSLAYYSKNNGAKFMTFYTGLTNHARYIYMGAGFKIIQSFCSFEKELK